MCIRLSSPNKAAGRLLVFFLMLTVQHAALALATDQKQAIQIEADTGELDDARNVNTYTGNVIVTQGSIRITGDKMTVHYNDNNEIEVLVVEGNPATYRQLPDSSKVYDQAQARRMEYHKRKNLVILINNARVTQESGSLSSNRIEYDTTLSRITASSAPETKGKQPGDKERVKIIIPAKTD